MTVPPARVSEYMWVSVGTSVPGMVGFSRPRRQGMIYVEFIVALRSLLMILPAFLFHQTFVGRRAARR